MINNRQKEQAEIMKKLIHYYREPTIILIKYLLVHKLLTKSEIASILDIDRSAIDNVYLKKGGNNV